MLCLWPDQSEFMAFLWFLVCGVIQVLFLCCVCGLISLSSWLFLWFLVCGVVQVLFLSLVVNFSVGIFLLLTLD